MHYHVPTGFLSERMLQKLTRAIDRSVGMVAAFTNADVYEPTRRSHQPPTTARSVDGNSNHSVPSWNWTQHSSSNSHHRKRSLVGFVRAAGDASLVSHLPLGTGWRHS